jgi:hydroxymethylpyrimidine/phosphomethylpyrimidine kinase
VRGSGCRFASHLAARLALGESLENAARLAAEHVVARLAENPA